MDILHVTEACGAGVRRHLELMLPELMKRGLSCGLLAYGNRFEDGFEESLGSLGLAMLKCVHMQGGRIVNLGRAIGLIRQTCHECTPKLVHLHAFSAGVSGRLARCQVPLIYSPHSFTFHKSAGFLARKCAYCTEFLLKGSVSEFFLVGNNELKDAHALGIGDDRIIMAQNCISADFSSRLLDRTTARAKLGIAENEPAAVVPCRLERQKALFALIDAVACLDANVFFHIYGSGSQKQALRKRISDLGLEKRIIIHEPVQTLRNCLRAFDIGILPSYYEGLSYALLEMVAAGLPVCVRNIDANKIGLDNRLVFFDNDAPELLASAMNETLSKSLDMHFRLPASYKLGHQVDIVCREYKKILMKY